MEKNGQEAPPAARGHPSAAQQLANETGANVVCVHNGTDGPVSDVIEAAGDRMGADGNAATDTLTRLLSESAQTSNALQGAARQDEMTSEVTSCYETGCGRTSAGGARVSLSQDEVPFFPGGLAPGALIGRWRVVERLGAGGQGAVYRVEDLDHPGDFYALKLALHARDGRAEREVALVMTRAAHPHVVGFHGCARWPHPREGCLGFVMDWVPGRPLHLWAESVDTTFRRLALACATVALTLGELHGRGVRHRDLKPEHIRIRESDGQPVLLDFGVGWYEGAAPLTTGPLPPGTLHLLSPEAIRFLWRNPERPGAHHVFQPAEDLYALGVCLYRATTGHYPFHESMLSDLLQYSIVHVRPVAPVDVNPRVPRALSDIIMRLLSKEPQARHPDGAALHAALVEAASSGEASWDASVFAWEEVPSEQAGGEPRKRLVQPARPRPEWPVVSPLPARPPENGQRRSQWPRRLVLAAMVLLILVPVTLVLSNVLNGSAVEWTADVRVDPAVSGDEQAPLPVTHQKRAPCTDGLELEFSGACWLPIVKQRPPDCPRQTITYKGQCLLPVPRPRPVVPTSVDGGLP